MSGDFYTWLREVRCTTAREVAERLEISLESARERLRRLERRGVLEKKFVSRVAVYCVKEGAQLPPPLTRGPRVETLRRMDQVVDLLTREGCISSSALCKTLGLGHATVRHITTMLLSQGRAVEVVVGKTAIWCRDREAAEELVAKLRETVHRLASRRRYITPSRLLQMVRRDKEAYGLFTKFVKLSRIDGDYIHPVALAFADSILASLYGDPIRYAPHRHVYLVSPQPRQDLGGIVIRDGATNAVTVSLTPDLAAALEDAERRGASADEVVAQAVEQLLARFR
jgi:DNA-binding Lrp family transcriptional regulator